MKKYLILLIATIITISSCKKAGDGTSNTLLLAEVYANGLLDNQYLYSTDKLLLRLTSIPLQEIKVRSAYMFCMNTTRMTWWKNEKYLPSIR